MFDLRMTWHVWKANRWARNGGNGKRFQYALHLSLTGDPRGPQLLAEWRGEIQEAMFDMWNVGPVAQLFRRDPESIKAMIGLLFDMTMESYFAKTPSGAVPYAGDLSDVWDCVAGRVAAMINELATASEGL